MTPTRPYLLRGIYEWVVDNGFTPHLMVNATIPGVVVPEKHIQDGKIVLNVAPQAVRELSMKNTWVTFDARFSGVTQHIRLPMESIEAVYAVENGRGMYFEPEDFEQGDDGDGVPPATTNGKPGLKIVK